MTQPTSAPTGRWYYVICVVSLGMLAWVPFVHAASRLKRRDLWQLAAAYGAIAFIAVAVLGSAPTDEGGTPVGAASDMARFGLLGLVVAACVQLRNIRRDVYGLPVPQSSGRGGNQAHIAAATAARERRRYARDLAARDPLMARELRVGRPDLHHDFDDGGLVDLNSAPAPAISELCGIPLTTAKAITQARETLGRFSSVDEALVYSQVTDASSVIKDRAITL